MRKIIVLILIFHIPINYKIYASSDVNIDSARIYDVIIIGAGISGLTAAYYLQNRDILVLEKEYCAGGRTVTEDIYGRRVNLGTQYLPYKGTYFDNFIKTLNIEYNEHSALNAKIGLVLGNDYYPDYTSIPKGFYILKELIKEIKNAFSMKKLIRKSDDNIIYRYDTILARSIFNNKDPIIRNILSTYAQSVSSAPFNDISYLWYNEILTDFISPIRFIKGGTISIIDTLQKWSINRISFNSEVKSISQSDEFVFISFNKEGKKYKIKCRNCIITTPAPICIDLIKGLPEWKIRSLNRVKYGSYITVTLVLSNINWERTLGAIVSDKLFSSWIDVNYSQGSRKKPTISDPLIINCFVPTLLNSNLWDKRDSEIKELVYTDFHKIFPEVKNSIMEMRLKRFVFGEPIPDTGYFAQLPNLQKPVKNIHFAGDYTDEPWLGGAFFSGLKTANELGIRNNIWTQPFKREVRKFDFWPIVFIFMVAISITCIIYFKTIYILSINYIFHDDNISVVSQKMMTFLKPVKAFLSVLTLLIISTAIFIAICLPPLMGVFRFLSMFLSIVLIISLIGIIFITFFQISKPNIYGKKESFKL
jgi:protoporphyrinogen oxidase